VRNECEILVGKTLMHELLERPRRR